MTDIHNKGTGAGGSNTNHNGIAFETKTDNEIRLILSGFVRKNITGKEKTKYGYYLEKNDGNKTTHFVKQNVISTKMKWRLYIHNIFVTQKCTVKQKCYMLHVSGSTFFCRLFIV